MVTFTANRAGQCRVHVWSGAWIKGKVDYPTEQVRQSPESAVRKAVAVVLNRTVSRMQRHPNDPDCYYIHLRMG